ncbi:putative esterase [Paraburkholderia sp. BL27I4N3]|uniref:alpha/beta hydrolase-fold protein n=1 Tax=Paraburkholderia sp. BL27I4N3 TaxID=1938805 RepID=UPI000E246FB2|nr:alpha/beta hydrolase-fold protein [Paraburkholderia sp. BL27I4N3]REE07383.1 putative esterase [Paraburkholderia sp. BL27I4N3]
MKEDSKMNVVDISPGSRSSLTSSDSNYSGELLSRGISRRDFGKLLGAQALVLSCFSLSGCGGGATTEQPGLQAAVKYGDPIVFDPATGGISLPYTGYYYGEIVAGGKTRFYKEYFPENSIYNGNQVMITIPDGYNTEDYLLRSGWKTLADKYNFTLFIMEPLNEQWGTVASEMAYVSAAYTLRGTTTDAGGVNRVGILGFGSGGQALQQLVMTNELSAASAVFVNASHIDSSYLASLSTQVFTGSSFGAVFNAADNTVYLNQVPVPVWIFETTVDATVQGVVNYWKGVNRTVSVDADFNGGKIFYQDPTNAAENHFTPRGAIANVAWSTQTVNPVDTGFNQMLYANFLGVTNRYGANVWNNAIHPHLDFTALGVKNYKFLDQGVLREYLVYVPPNLRNGTAPLPVVYTLPGGDTNHFTNFENTRWNEQADKYGYIIVSVAGAGTNKASYLGSPANKWVTGSVYTKFLAFNDTGTTTPGYVDDISFFKTLIARVETDYKIDPTRRFIAAHSNGAAFSLEMVRVIPQYFAAFSRLSGHLTRNPGLPDDLAINDLPIYAIIGENNSPSVLMNGTLAPGFNTSFTNYLVNNLGYTAVAAAALIANPGINGLVEDLHNGMVHKTWEWRDANSVPICRATTTSLRGHSFIMGDIPNMAEWFTHWSRVNGKLVYKP